MIITTIINNNNNVMFKYELEYLDNQGKWKN